MLVESFTVAVVVRDPGLECIARSLPTYIPLGKISPSPLLYSLSPGLARVTPGRWVSFTSVGS